MTENKECPPSPTSAPPMSNDEEQSKETESTPSDDKDLSREDSSVSAPEQNNNNVQDQQCPSEENHPEDKANTENEGDDKNQFDVGDHVYSWCSFWGIPNAYQHHGIVIDQDRLKATVTILDFSCLVQSDSEMSSSGSFQTPASSYHASTSSSSEGLTDGDAKANSIVREFTIDASHAGTVWKKVRYGAPWTERVFRRPGTTSKALSDPVEIVLARAEFVMKRHRDALLSSYDLFRANCEHVAVWCKTGQFCSLQLGAVLHQSVALSTVPTVIASQATTTIPAAGLWGWLGYTTTVSLSTTMPWLIPMTILGPAAVAGTSAFNLKRWKQTTERLNSSFEDREKSVLYRATVLEIDETEVYEKKLVPT